MFLSRQGSHHTWRRPWHRISGYVIAGHVLEKYLKFQWTNYGGVWRFCHTQAAQVCRCCLERVGSAWYNIVCSGFWHLNLFRSRGIAGLRYAVPCETFDQMVLLRAICVFLCRLFSSFSYCRVFLENDAPPGVSSNVVKYVDYFLKTFIKSETVGKRWSIYFRNDLLK